MSRRPHQTSIAVQIQVVKRHLKRRCTADSHTHDYNDMLESYRVFVYLITIIQHAWLNTNFPLNFSSKEFPSKKSYRIQSYWTHTTPPLEEDTGPSFHSTWKFSFPHRCWHCSRWNTRSPLSVILLQKQAVDMLDAASVNGDTTAISVILLIHTRGRCFCPRKSAFWNLKYLSINFNYFL
jgi:hypothetical protein